MELRDIESKFGAAGPEARPALAEKQSVILGKIVLAAEPEEREFWVKQMSETLASAVQENVLPSGIELLEKLVASLKDEESLQSFAKFRLASARYAVNMQGADADIDKAQRAWLEELRKFIEEHPSAPDTPEAMLQIAISEEFSGNEQKAIELYDKIVADFRCRHRHARQPVHQSDCRVWERSLNCQELLSMESLLIWQVSEALRC